MNEKEFNRLEKLSNDYWNADSYEAVDIAMSIIEKAPYLIAEIKRLNEKYENIRELFCGANRERVKERDQLLEDIQLYKELFIVANSKNMGYTMVLEKNISILRSVLQVIKNQIDYDEGIALGGVIVQLEKALEVDTNE